MPCATARLQPHLNPPPSSNRTPFPPHGRQCPEMSRLIEGVGHLIAGTPRQRSPAGHLIPEIGHSTARTAHLIAPGARLIPGMRHFRSRTGHSTRRHAVLFRHFALSRDSLGHSSGSRTRLWRSSVLPERSTRHRWTAIARREPSTARRDTSTVCPDPWIPHRRRLGTRERRSNRHGEPSTVHRQRCREEDLGMPNETVGRAAPCAPEGRAR